MKNHWSDEQVLSHFGSQGAPLIGQGGEARVFDIGEDRVLRLVRAGGGAEAQRMRADLLQEISAGHRMAFRTPRVLEIREVGGRVAVIEEKLTGITLAKALKTADAKTRHKLICSYLDAAASIGDIKIHKPFWGDIFSPPGIRASTYRVYVVEKLDSVRRAGGPLAQLIAKDSNALPDCSSPSLVHFDIFPDNVLAEDCTVSAVIDFGASCKIADRRLDVWSAVAYLDPELSPSAADADRNTALDWLDAQGLGQDYPAAKRWIASCWCFAHNDPAVRSWCQRVLAA